jgi:DNA repair protein RadB
MSGSKPSTKRALIKLRPRDHPVIATGIPLLDEVLQGGFRKDSIIHLYGEPGSGKTTFAMHVMAHIMHEGWKGIWVDVNHAFSLDKFAKIVQDAKTLKTLMLVQPTSFQHQTQLIQNIKLYLDRVGIVVVDPITHYYRAERFTEASQGFFQELIDTQLGGLVGIAHMQQIPILVINYATLEQNGAKVPLVARGFQRVERYRFYFCDKNREEDHIKYLTIEYAPEKYAQQQTFAFQITAAGITGFQLKPTEEAE